MKFICITYKNSLDLIFHTEINRGYIRWHGHIEGDDGGAEDRTQVQFDRLHRLLQERHDPQHTGGAGQG